MPEHPQGILSNSQVQALITAIYRIHYIPVTVVYLTGPLMLLEDLTFPYFSPLMPVIKNHKNSSSYLLGGASWCGLILSRPHFCLIRYSTLAKVSVAAGRWVERALLSTQGSGELHQPALSLPVLKTKLCIWFLWPTGRAGQTCTHRGQGDPGGAKTYMLSHKL